MSLFQDSHTPKPHAYYERLLKEWVADIKRLMVKEEYGGEDESV